MQGEEGTSVARRFLRRRGMVAGLAGVVAGYLAKASERVAQAANGDPIVVGGNHSGTSITQLSTTNGANVFRASAGTGAGTGVNGRTGSGYGVYGEADSGAGVFGVSNTLFGVYGYSYGTGGAAVGVYGVANTGEGIAAISQTGTALHANSISGTAGIFDGPVIINGSLTVSGIKSAAVPGADGEPRRMYCLESPVSYFEDFGRVKLSRGRATVRLDREFAGTVVAADYDVVLTPYGDCHGVCVVERTPQGFTIQELQGGGSSVEVAYRVTAKRKDIENQRLPRVKLPEKANGRRMPKPPGLPGIPGVPEPPGPPRQFRP